MLIINHFVIKFQLHGMVTRRSRRWVPWRSITSLYFLNATLYLARNTEMKYQLQQSFYNLTMFYKKGVLELKFSYIHKTSLNNVT